MNQASQCNSQGSRIKVILKGKKISRLVFIDFLYIQTWSEIHQKFNMKI